MTVGIQGTVPFPPAANPAPIARLSADLKRMSMSLQQGSAQLTSTASTATATWTGAASRAFTQHTNERARNVRTVAACVGRASTVLDTMSSAVATSIAAYQSAATAEQVARAGMPWTAAALAAAIAAETAAVVALQGAGVACATALAAVEIEIGLSQFLGVDRQMFEQYKESARQLWQAATEFAAEGDADAAIKLLNTSITMPNSDGTSTRTSALGWLLQADPKVNTLWQGLQGVFSAGVLLTEPPLAAIEQPKTMTAAMIAAGFQVRPTTATQLGINQDLVEMTRRRTGIEADQSMLVVHTRGVDSRDRSNVLSLTLPGIVSPDQPGALNGATGSRNAVNAGASQISGFGQEELALRNWVLQQGLRPGDTVNLYAHSQGGIVSRNLANDLVTRGYRVNVVSFAPPDGQYREGVSVYNFQNERDFVPALRIAGDGGARTTLFQNQHNVRFDAAFPGILDNHESENYGPAIDRLPAGSSAGVDAFRRFQEDQARFVSTDHTGVTSYLGGRTPHGQPVDLRNPGSYVVPSGPTPGHTPVPRR